MNLEDIREPISQIITSRTKKINFLRPINLNTLGSPQHVQLSSFPHES